MSSLVSDVHSMYRKPPTSGDARGTWLWSVTLRAILALLLVLITLPWIVTHSAYASTTPTAYGVDISHYNTVTDPAAIRANGITFAYVKVTQGTTYADPTATTHTTQLRGAGIRVGGYHYATGPDCAADARWFRAHLTADNLLGPGALAPMLDLETPALASSADTCVRNFYDTLHAPTLLVYGNLTWWTTYLHPATWGTRTILGWIARYTGQPGQPGYSAPILAVHQHTNRGSVPGIVGFVDRDALMPGRQLAELVLGSTVPAPALIGHIYIVRPGDTLSAIAARLRYPGGWRALARHNRLTHPDRIYAGQPIAV